MQVNECGACGDERICRIYTNINNKTQPIGFELRLCKTCAVYAAINGYVESKKSEQEE